MKSNPITLTPCSNIYIRLFSSVQNKFKFILHEPYNLSWPLSGRSLGENMYYCASSISFLKEKQTHLIIKLSFLFVIRNLSIKIEMD